MKKLILSLSVSVLFSLNAMAVENTVAGEASDRAAMTITSVTVTEEIPTAAEIWSGFIAPSVNPAVNEEVFQSMDWVEIIKIGKEIIEIIKENRPVVNITRDAVHAVPATARDWQELSGWQAPVTKAFRVSMKNAYGMTMVNVRLKVSAMWGGNYSGRGQYLANVVVVPTEVTAQWGVTLDIWSESRTPVNVGTLAQPVAGLGFDLRYKARTWVTEINGTQDYFVTGLGELKVTE